MSTRRCAALLSLLGLGALVAACAAESTTVGSVDSQATNGDGGDAGVVGADGEVSSDGSGPFVEGGGFDAACVTPPYPGGPYGVLMGSVLSPKPSWTGYVDGATTATTIVASDYFDGAQCRGISALFIVEIDASDPTAEDVTTLIAQNLAGPWAGGHVRVLQLVTRGSTGAAATLADADSWRAAHAATWSVAVDAAETYQSPADGFYPQIRLVVDTCSMVVTRWVHRDDVTSDVTAFAKRTSCP